MHVIPPPAAYTAPANTGGLPAVYAAESDEAQQQGYEEAHRRVEAAFLPILKKFKVRASIRTRPLLAASTNASVNMHTHVRASAQQST